MPGDGDPARGANNNDDDGDHHDGGDDDDDAKGQRHGALFFS